MQNRRESQFQDESYQEILWIILGVLVVFNGLIYRYWV
jgi:hypothetical protein